MSGLSKQAHALLLHALLPYPSKKPKPKQSFFGLLIHLWKNKLQKFLKSVWAISLYLCLAFICSYATPTVGRSLLGRCWSSGREVIVKRICSAKLPVQILDHSQSLLKANFIYLWLAELKLLSVKPTQVMIALKLHQVNFAHLAFHTVVREIMVSSRAIAVSKPNQCRNSEGSSRGSFKGQRAPCLTVTGCVLFLVTFF